MKQSVADLTQKYSSIVERYAAFFPRPEIRLKFFNSTIAKQVARQRKLENTLRHLSFIRRTPFYRWAMESMLHRIIMEELNELLPTMNIDSRQALRQMRIPFGARLFFLIHRARYVFYGLGLASVALLIFGLYSAALWSGGRLNAYLEHKYGRAGAGPAGVITTQIAKFLPGYNPDNVWLVKKDATSELYSNGARIQTEFETDNHKRNYYLYSRDEPLSDIGGEVQHKIAGIVYHTTEGEMVDFKADNNHELLRHSKGLLDWVKTRKSYNYVIDRIGQIYRVVRDEQAADHAGHSIWRDNRYTYVSLNESFLGVAFETSMETDTNEQLTEAQVVAGRQLTAVLRSKFQIQDVNCTTHGLVSISASNMLIGFHHDWVKNFPFEAMGLTDKYAVPPATVAVYGCGWDPDILAKLGGSLWSGVPAAQAEFDDRARQASLKPDELRKKMKERYSEQLEVSRKLRDSGGTDADQASTASSDQEKH